ncbi:hypothetical protein A4R44_00936 [Amycolatopsis sp. M39]|nr:hypothetical protein A4R44_00936 [Amycolatopsis sp. M39]
MTSENLASSASRTTTVEELEALTGRPGAAITPKQLDCPGEGCETILARSPFAGCGHRTADAARHNTFVGRAPGFLRVRSPTRISFALPADAPGTGDRPRHFVRDPAARRRRNPAAQRNRRHDRRPRTGSDRPGGLPPLWTVCLPLPALATTASACFAASRHRRLPGPLPVPGPRSAAIRGGCGSRTYSRVRTRAGPANAAASTRNCCAAGWATLPRLPGTAFASLNRCWRWSPNWACRTGDSTGSGTPAVLSIRRERALNRGKCSSRTSVEPGGTLLAAGLPMPYSCAVGSCGEAALRGGCDEAAELPGSAAARGRVRAGSGELPAFGCRRRGRDD